MSDPTNPAPRAPRPAWKFPAAVLVVLAVFVGILFATGVVGDSDDGPQGRSGSAAS